MWEALGRSWSGHRCDSEVLLTFLLIISWEQNLRAVSLDCAWRCSKEQGVQIRIMDVVHSCTLGSPSSDLLFFLALQCMWGPKCMTSAHVYAAWICPMGLTLWAAYDLLLLKDCISCVLLFWFWCFGRVRLGVRAGHITGMRVTKGSYCIFLKSVLSWQEFLLRQQ